MENVGTREEGEWCCVLVQLCSFSAMNRMLARIFMPGKCTPAISFFNFSLHGFCLDFNKRVCRSHPSVTKPWCTTAMLFSVGTPQSSSLLSFISLVSSILLELSTTMDISWLSLWFMGLAFLSLPTFMQLSQRLRSACLAMSFMTSLWVLHSTPALALLTWKCGLRFVSPGSLFSTSLFPVLVSNMIPLDMLPLWVVFVSFLTVGFDQFW